MDAVLAGVFAVPLDLLFQRRNGEGFGQGDAAVGFETGDKLPGCHIQVRAGTVLFELERLPVIGYRLEYPTGIFLASGAG